MRAMNRHSMILGFAVRARPHGVRQRRAQLRTNEPPAASDDAAATTASPDTASHERPLRTAPTYATTAFNLPFDLTVPAWLEAAPSIEQPNFVTWVASDRTDRAVRFLIPVNVYPPGGTATDPAATRLRRLPPRPCRPRRPLHR